MPLSVTYCVTFAFLVSLCNVGLVHTTAIIYNPYSTKAILEERPITLDPDDSTCRPKNGESHTFLSFNRPDYYYDDFPYADDGIILNEERTGPTGSGIYPNDDTIQRIYCNSTCPRTLPNNYTVTVLVDGQTDLGYPGCTEVPDLLRMSAATPTTTATGVRSRRQVNPRRVCSLVSNRPGGRLSTGGMNGETYTMWVRPDPGHEQGTLISAMGSLGMGEYSLKLSRNILELKVMGSSRAYNQAPIPPNVFTHIALQVTYSVPISLAVYVNGSLLQSPILAQIPSMRFKRQSGDGSANNPVFIGISGTPYFVGGFCEVQTVQTCQALGYSAFVSTNTKYTGIKATEEATLKTLAQVKASCTNISAELRDLYVCSSMMLSCITSQMSIKPCRSLCKKFSDKCYIPNSELPQGRQCSNLPTNNCVNETFTPDYGMFRGTMKKVVHHGGVLTDREIQKDMTGSLPEVRVKSECLCQPPSTTIVSDLLCSLPTNGYTGTNRLGNDYRVPEAINDKPWPNVYERFRTSWFSADGIDDLTITVKFTQRQMVYNISYDLPQIEEVTGLFANLTTIQLLGDDREWKTVAFITMDCGPYIGYHSKFNERQNLSPRSPQCYSISHYDNSVTLDMLSGRSGVNYRRDGTSIHPTVQQFLTGTAMRFKLEGHFNPRNKFYGISNLAANGWNTTEDVCECFDGGLAPGIDPLKPCDSNNRCQCRPDSGDPGLSSYTCFPYTVSGTREMVPNYGPESGGTLIVITGGFFGNASARVTFGGYTEFEVLEVTETNITCKSPNVTGTVNLYKPMKVEISLYIGTSNSISFVLEEEFEFREDPIIESITPLSTFLKGGINQTVTGQFIDSVYAPLMTVTIVHTDGDSTTNYPQPPSVCFVTNSTQMICRSPNVFNLPDEYINLLVENQNSEDTSRQKRQAKNAIVNKNDFQFYVGFLLDGLKRYNNVSEELPEYGIIDVYINPDIYPWTGNDKIRLFQAYKGDKQILIEGERMTYGCTKEDYEIRIGDEICKVERLFVGTLTCTPPSSEPALGSLQKDGAPSVTAKVGNIEEFVGYLQYHETAWDDPSVKGAVLGVLIGLVVVVIIVIIIVIMKKKRAQKRKDAEANKYSEPPTAWSLLPNSVKAELEPCMKCTESLNLGRKVGEGNFGKVYVGSFKDDKGAILVAAKSVKNKSITTKELLEFLEEATLMKDFNHKHVLNLVGVVLQNDLPFVLLPLMENADLRTFILNPSNQFTVADLLNYGLQVASGMQYLAGRKFVHRDLAARNCMVSKDDIVKVADFGLARDIYSNEYYRVENKSRPLPVKWMAPEALDDFKFTTKSDVWSYGVLLWELLTRGKKPYSHVDNFELKVFLKKGKRLDKPSVAPEEVYELMLQCWNMNPNNRPTFTEIENEMKIILSGSDNTKPTMAQSTVNASADGYQELSKYVDHTTDRHGYEHLHEEQGYLDMSGQVDYLEAAKELGLDASSVDQDGYLAPIESRPSKPKPSPRKHIGTDVNKSQYMNVSILHGRPNAKSHEQDSAGPSDIDMVEIPAPHDNPRGSDVPLYMNAQEQNVQYMSR